MPPGLYQYSVVISTAQREMKITAPTKERHDIWLNVNYLFLGSARMSVFLWIPFLGPQVSFGSSQPKRSSVPKP